LIVFATWAAHARRALMPGSSSNGDRAVVVLAVTGVLVAGALGGTAALVVAPAGLVAGPGLVAAGAAPDGVPAVVPAVAGAAVPLVPVDVAPAGSTAGLDEEPEQPATSRTASAPTDHSCNRTGNPHPVRP
jgi:hypothetical protein